MLVICIDKNLIFVLSKLGLGWIDERYLVNILDYSSVLANRSLIRPIKTLSLSPP